MNKIQILKISLVSLFFIGALILLGYLGVFSNVLNLSQSASVRDAVKGKAVYNIHPSKIQPGVFTFDYVFDKNVKPPKGEALFDLPIIPFDEKVACEELQRNYPGMPCEFGPLRDSWNYPVHENAFMKGETKEDASREKKVSLNPFTPKEVLAYDVDVSDPSVLNCRSNTNVTGYFKAYFVDVVEDLDIGFDDPDYGLARRTEACQVLQDISELIMLDTTSIKPKIIFRRSNISLPTGALAGASTYYYGSPSLDNGVMRDHIILGQNEVSSMDAFVITNFNGSIQWDVDTYLNSGTYDLYTVLYHEILHTLGFNSLLPDEIVSTNDLHKYSTFNYFSYKDASVNEPFISHVTNFLQAPVGSPSSWFITNTVVYQGTKNIDGATPDDIIPIYSPSSWQQGSSLSHFDMNRVYNNEGYVMHPSIGLGTERVIHEQEKEVLCHLGYMVEGLVGCENATPIARNDVALPTNGQVCISPLDNDTSALGGLKIYSLEPLNVQTGDILTYYGNSNDCTGVVVSSSTGAMSIAATIAPGFGIRQFVYTNADTLSNRISDAATITIAPPCNNEVSEYVCNGDFEYGSMLSLSGGAFSCPNNFSDAYSVPYWCNYKGTPDLSDFQNLVQSDFSVNASGHGSYVSHHWSAVEQGASEAFITKLKQGLDPSENYILSFDMFSDFGDITPGDKYVTVGLRQTAPVSASLNSIPSTPSQVIVDSSVQGGGWGHYQYSFTPDISILKYLVLWGYSDSESVVSFLFDNISIKRANQISGTIYYDINQNEIIDPTETKFQNITVNLYEQGSSTPLQTTTTQGGSNLGKYVFDNLPVGIYYIASNIENTYPIITQPVLNTGILSNYDYVYEVIVASDQTVANKDFGIYVDPIGQISGTVYEDNNSNGSLDNSETGLNNVNVFIYDANQNLLDSWNTVLSPEEGEYTFSTLPGGVYYIVSGITQGSSGVEEVTEPNIDTGFLNNYDYGYMVEVPFTGNQVFSDRNFGVKMLTHQITGIVYEDLNNDSYNQSVEPGIEGIEVLAYEYSITGNSGASAIHSTLTQSDGTYEFMVPDMKEYYVVLEDESIFPTINTFNAWTNASPIDNDYENIYSAVFANGTNYGGYMPYRFGIYEEPPTGQISGTVYYDEDTSSSLDITESGIPTTAVNLYDSSSTLLQTVTTQSQGEYEFTVLPDGTYYLASEAESNYSTSTQPSLNTGLVNNHDYVYEVNISNGQAIVDKNFGVYDPPTGQISGTVYYDTNFNQIAESNETRFPNTTVKLYEQNSSTPLQTTTTQSGSQIGEYVFNALPDGAYYVVSDIENNYQSVTVPGSSSSPSGYIYAHTVTIANGQAVIDKNFGVFSKSGETSISGKVYYDSNLNGDFDGNDYGIGGLYVKLFNGNSLVQAAETWLSGPATGNYTFQNVPDGFYIIVLSEEDNYPTVTEPGPHIDLSGGILNDYDYVYFLNISGGQSITGPITGADFGVSNKRKFIKWDLRIKERINNLTVSPNTEPIINPGGKPTIKDWDLEARKQRRESASEEDKKKTNALGAWLFKLFD